MTVAPGLCVHSEHWHLSADEKAWFQARSLATVRQGHLGDSINNDDALHLAQSTENIVAVRLRDNRTPNAMLGANRKNADTANKAAEPHGALDGTEAKKQPRHFNRGDLVTDIGRGHRSCSI